MTHPTDDSLKPCPFCGGAAAVFVMRDESIWSHEIVPYTKIECEDCGIGTEYLCEGWEPTAQEAWNTRALLAAQPAQERQTYKPGNGGDCAICRQPEGDHYRHGNDCPDMRGVGQAE